MKRTKNEKLERTKIRPKKYKSSSEIDVENLTYQLEKAGIKFTDHETVVMETLFRDLYDMGAKLRGPPGLTGDVLMTALERADVAADAEIRIEFDGDDSTPQVLEGIETRESEGVRYTCIMVRNA